MAKSKKAQALIGDGFSGFVHTPRVQLTEAEVWSVCFDAAKKAQSNMRHVVAHLIKAELAEQVKAAYVKAMELSARRAVRRYIRAGHVGHLCEEKLLAMTRDEMVAALKKALHAESVRPGAKVGVPVKEASDAS